MSTTQPLTGPLMKSGARTVGRGAEYVQAMFEKFHVSRYAVYVDHTTVTDDVPELEGKKMVGYYTFDINLVGKAFKDASIALLSTDGPVPECDGWLVASTSRASAFSLAKTLHGNGREEQIICRFYGGQTTEMDAYMDLFSGETETMMYLNHYFDRKYRIVFPLDIRYTVCECDGTVRLSGQRIVPPGGTIVFDSRDMELGKFKGFLRVELEVENLQVRVQPFIHFWADYINDAGMCRNHQSGWSPHPPGAVFNRGILPVEPDLEALGSFYNANNEAARITALLHFNQDGEEKSVERDLQPVAPGHMRYENFSKLFEDVNLDGVKAAYVLVSCDKPLHRPNHYTVVAGTGKVIDTYHQTKGKARYWAEPTQHYGKEELDLFNQYGISPWVVCVPILEKRFKMESYLGLLPEVICDLPGATFEVVNSRAEIVGSEEMEIKSTDPVFLSIDEYLKERDIDIDKGFLCIKPPREHGNTVNLGPVFFWGIRHHDAAHIATTFCGGNKEAQLPFYVGSRFPFSREYEYSPLQISDLFAPAVVSEEYDSLLVVRHQSLLRDYRDTVEYRLDIVDARGRQYSLHKSIPPMTFHAFWASELLDEAGVEEKEGYYTLWVKSCDAYLNSFHGLYRKKDHAMSFDDASEGTLQVDPQIAGINPQKHMDQFAKFLQGRGVLGSIPESWKDYLKKLKAGKQLAAG